MQNITITSHSSRGVSNHRQGDCLFNSFFRPTAKKHQSSLLLALCEGNPPVFPCHASSWDISNVILTNIYDMFQCTVLLNSFLWYILSNEETTCLILIRNHFTVTGNNLIQTTTLYIQRSSNSSSVVKGAQCLLIMGTGSSIPAIAWSWVI